MSNRPNPHDTSQTSHAGAHTTAEQSPIAPRKALAGVFVVLAIMAVLGAIGILHRMHDNGVLAKETDRDAPLTVNVETAQTGAPTDNFVLPGNVTAFTDSPIYARTDGYLLHWYYDIGAKVKKGALLAEISTPELDQQLKQAEADLATAEATAKNAHVQANRYSDLVTSDAVSQQDTDTFVNQAAATAATVRSAQANVQRLKELQSFEEIYAPFDGVVTARNVDTGQLINQGASVELFHMQALQTLRVYTNVPQLYSEVIKRGMKVPLTFPEYPGKTFVGTVVRTADAIDPVSRTLLVEVDVGNRSGKLMPGALAQVHFRTQPIAATFVVPAAALIFRKEGLRVGTVVKDKNGNDVARLVPVIIGQDDGATVQIVHGLNPGDRVIQDPPDSILDGERVTTVSPASSAGGNGEPATGNASDGDDAPGGGQVNLPSHRGRGLSHSRLSNLILSAAPLAALAAGALLVTGCKPVGPNYQKPGFTAPAAYNEVGASSVVPPPNPQGGAWTPANPSDGMLKGKWWEIYQDPQLNKLEDRITDVNVQLKQAVETYLAARDQVTVARANLFPTLSANVNPSELKYSQNQPLFGKGNPTTYTDLNLTGQASWEPDFWGRVRRTVEQARATAQATAAETANVDLSLHAEMATDYFGLRGLDSQTQLLTATVADLQRQLDLTQQRLRGGVATAVDVAQAETQLETVRAQLVETGVARSQFEHAIGTLANDDLSAFKIPFSPLNVALPKVPVGVPSQLLERRPDIAAAERQTAAANESIGIAISAFYPNIGLSASGGFQSTHPGTWIQGPSSMWSLGGQAAELLFDAGQRHALTDQARHNYQAQVDGYRNTVFQAFDDVEDELSALRILERESGVEQQAVASAQRSFNLSNQRYKGGVTSYLEVLTAEQTLLQDQSTAISLETRQFAASVSLVRALGGGWDVTQLPK